MTYIFKDVIIQGIGRNIEEGVDSKKHAYILTEVEKELILKLNQQLTLIGYYTVDYDESKYPNLTDLLYIIGDDGKNGKIHADAVRGLAGALPKKYDPDDSTYLSQFSEMEQKILKNVSKGMTLKGQLDSIKSEELDIILGNLNYVALPERGQTKERVIFEVLTTSSEMINALSVLPEDAVKQQRPLL